MDNKILTIKPMDSIFCREGFCFEKGVSNWIQGLKKPYPSVFYGAIISSLLRQDKLKDLLKDHKQIESKLKADLKIKGIYIYDEYNQKIWIKAPSDLFISEFFSRVGIYKENLLWAPNKEYDQALDYWISIDDFFRFYSKCKRIEKSRLKKTSDFYIDVEKTGVDIDYSKRVVQESHLYNITMTEFKDYRYSYLIDLDHNNLFENEVKDIVLLGGESKTARMQSIIEQTGVEQYEEDTVIKSEFVKVIFTSPIKFETWTEIGINIKYQIANSLKYVGGFDMANNSAKKMQRLIPEGAVWIIENKEFKDKTLKDIRNLLEIEFEKFMSENYRGFANYLILEFEGER